eukprot:12420378-Karenia_brevis.AAC.1
MAQQWHPSVVGSLTRLGSDPLEEDCVWFARLVSGALQPLLGYPPCFLATFRPGAEAHSWHGVFRLRSLSWQW